MSFFFDRGCIQFMGVKCNLRQELPQVETDPDVINMRVGKDAMPDILRVQSVGTDTFDHFQIHSCINQYQSVLTMGIDQVYGTPAVPHMIDILDNFPQKIIPPYLLQLMQNDSQQKNRNLFLIPRSRRERNFWE
jgi:hypothetical protein